MKATKFWANFFGSITSYFIKYNDEIYDKFYESTVNEALWI